MAEIVEKKMEEMISEFEEMERIGLLTSEELRVLVMKRRHFMYKLGAMSLSKKDILAYFEYETMLLEVLDIRRKKERMFEKVEQIEHSIFRRLMKLLCMATRRFSHDIQLWEKRITFAKTIGFPEMVWHAYREMSQKHPRVLSVWVDWAHYEITVLGNFQKAREILVSQAVLHHPGSKALFREIFRFELMYCEHLFRGRSSGDASNDGSVKVLSDTMKKVFNCDGARLVYQEAVAEHSDIHTAIEFYHVANIFPFAADLHFDIFQDICERFGDKAEVRLLRAGREALGFGDKAEVRLLRAGREALGLTDEGASLSQSLLETKLPTSDRVEEDKSDDQDDSGVEDNDATGLTDEDDVKKKSLLKVTTSNKKAYLGPYRLYLKSRDRKKLELKPIPSTAEDREAALSRLLESSHLYVRPPILVSNSSMSEPKLTKSTANIERRVADLDLVNSENGRMITLVIRELLALMHHCWSCPTSLYLLVQKFTKLCQEQQTHLSPQQLLLWAIAVSKFPDVDCSQSYEELLECVCEGTSPAACVHALGLLARSTLAGHDDQVLVRVFKKMEARLPEAWRHAALRGVLGALQPGPLHEGFLGQLCHTPSLDRGLVTSARVALLWAARKHSGRQAAREVYRKYEIFPPFSEEFYATMCFLELSDDASVPLVRIDKEDSNSVQVSVPGDQFIIDTKGDGLSDGESDAEDEVNTAQESEDDENAQEREHNSEEERNVSEDERDSCDDDENSDGDDNKSSDNKDSSEDDDDSSENDDDSSEDDDDSSDDEIKLRRKAKKREKAAREYSSTEDNAIDVERIRSIFKTATRLLGGKNHGLWLAYRQFEVKFGDTRSVSHINCTAEHHMEAWCVHAFKNSVLDIQQQRFVDESTVAELMSPSLRTTSVATEPARPTYLDRLLPNFLPLLSSAKKAKRDAFMAAVAAVDALSDHTPDVSTTLGRTWYDVLTILLDGKRILPRIRPETDTHPSTVPTEGQLHTDSLSASFSGVAKQSKKKRVVSSTSLSLKAGEHCSDAVRRHNSFAAVACRNPRDNLDAMLAQSSTLKPEILKKTELAPTLSKTAAKRKAKAERKKTAGKGWDYMAAPEITPEIANDLELLKMRGIMNPKQRFKTTHMKVTPKYFQMATCRDDPIHFYNRLTKKQRKPTLAEEIINDQEVVSYQKRKYAQLVAQRESHRSKKRKTGEEFIAISKNV